MKESRTTPWSHRVASVLLAICLVAGLGGVAAASAAEDLDEQAELASDHPETVDAADADPCREVLQPVVDEVGVPVVVPSCSVP